MFFSARRFLGTLPVVVHGARLRRWARRRELVCYVLFALPACTDGRNVVASSSDAQLDSSDIPARVLEPVMTPCPRDWYELASPGGAPGCSPYPAGAPETCAPGQAHFPGRPGCESIGPPCPADDFPAVPADGIETAYVLPGSVDGDGTRERPFAAVLQARHTRSKRIVLGRGRYALSAEELDGLEELVGACAAETSIDDVKARTLRSLRNVTVRMLSALPAGGRLELDGVDVGFASTLAGLLEIRRSVVGTVTTSSVDLRDSVIAFLQTGADAVVYLDNVAVRGRVRMIRGGCLELVGALAYGSAVSIEGCDGGIFVSEGETRLARSRLLDLNRPNTGIKAPAISVVGGRLEIVGTLISGVGVAGMGAFAPDDTSTVPVELLVRDTTLERVRATEAQPFGDGVAIQGSHTRALLERVVVRDVERVGVLVTDAELTARDLAVREVLSGVDGTGGAGVIAQLAATVEGRRLAIGSTSGFGFLANESRAVEVDDLAVTHVSATPCTECPAQYGVGLGMFSTTGSFERLAIGPADLCGVFIGTQSTLSVSSGLVSDVPVGVCVGDVDLDLEALDIRARNVDRSIDGLDLPVPAPAVSVIAGP